MHPEIFSSPVILNKEAFPGVFHISIKSSMIAQKVRPGQFIMVRIDEGHDPLLRRPFSLCGAEKNIIEILFQVKGKGTEIMSGWKPGHVVNIMGPLGNGFRIPAKTKTACLVAGGMGIAPLIFLMKHIKHSHEAIDIILFMGGKSEKDVSLLKALNLQGCDVLYAAEDGTRGFHGLVTDLFLEHMDNDSSLHSAGLAIFGCGPLRMLKALAHIAHKHDIHCQLSVESRMACGTGACLGCVISAKNHEKTATSKVSYKRVCAEGPVFDGREIE